MPSFHPGWHALIGAPALAVFLCLGTAASAQVPDLCPREPAELRRACIEARDLLLRDNGPLAEHQVLITGRTAGWRYRHRLDGVGRPGETCLSDGPLVLPAGDSVELQITAEDDIRDWRLPELGLALTGIPGRISTQTVTLKPGGYRAGAIELRVVTLAAYTAWLRRAQAGNCAPAE